MDEQRGEFRFTPPNKGWLKVYGKVSEDQIAEILKQAAEASSGLPYFLLEVDISEMDGATPEARRVTAKYFREMPPLALAILGGSFAQRTIAKLVLKAAQILQGENKDASDFFTDQQSAAAWLEMEAAHFQSKGSFK